MSRSTKAAEPLPRRTKLLCRSWYAVGSVHVERVSCAIRPDARRLLPLGNGGDSYMKLLSVQQMKGM
jgi:hypothetical protein